MKTVIALAALFGLGGMMHDARADFVVGMQGGFSSTPAVSSSSRTGNHLSLPLDGDGTALGLFAQSRHAINDDITIGIHLGYAHDTAEWERTFDSSSTEFPVLSNTYKYEVEYAYDILGFLRYRGEKISPFVMLGLTNMKVEDTYVGHFMQKDRFLSVTTRTGSNTMNGWKLAVGAEYALGDDKVIQVLMHYADFSSERFHAINSRSGYEFETQQTGIRIAIGRRF
ncbi:MAG: outer membrane beta-barrel protein [Gammaproteobacteria bacterium]